MKIRKLLAVALTVTLLCGSVNVNAYAAEVNTAETVTDVESTEESTNEDTEAGEDISSITEESSEENVAGETETTETEEVAEETTEETEVKETKTDDTEKTEENKEVKKAEKKKAAYTKADLKLMSALIFCEAGSESYAGKLAVGIVVMNRVESKKFPSTLKGVVYQKYQFGPARNGSLSRAMTAYENNKFIAVNHKDSIKAAKEALSGTKTVKIKDKKISMKDMLYFSGRVSGAKLTIGGHQFK